MFTSPDRLKRIGTFTMLFGIALTSSFGALAFVFDSLLPLLIQLAGHIGFMVSPIFIKVGYVLRLIAIRQHKIMTGTLQGGPAQ